MADNPLYSGLTEQQKLTADSVIHSVQQTEYQCAVDSPQSTANQYRHSGLSGIGWYDYLCADYGRSAVRRTPTLVS